MMSRAQMESLALRAEQQYQKSDSPVYREVCLNVMTQLNHELKSPFILDFIKGVTMMLTGHGLDVTYRSNNGKN